MRSSSFPNAGHIFGFLALLALLALPGAAGAVPPIRPVSERGPAARTLLLYAENRTAFSLADTLEGLKFLLQRVATHLETVPIAQADPATFGSSDYLVVFCPQPSPVLTTNFLTALGEARQPVLWIGFGAEQLAGLARFKGQFDVSARPAEKAVDHLIFRGSDWNVPVYPWIPVLLSSNSTANVLISATDVATNQPVSRPLCWQFSNMLFLVAVPSGGPLKFLVADLLLDFYGVKEIPPARLFLRIEDYHCGSNHRDFQRMADYLYSRGVPFLVSVIPACRDAESGQVQELDSQPEFVAALRYAQQRGGRLVMQGYAHEPGRGEFWDLEHDRPLAEDNASYTRERLHKGARQLIQENLFPLAWETPDYAASRTAYGEIARVFSIAVERVQLSDATCLEKETMLAPFSDSQGRLILPENLGYVLGGTSNVCDGIKSAAELLTKLRGPVMGCHIHAYQPLARLAELVDTLESFHIPFLDLAELDNAVQIPGFLLLAGGAERTLNLRNATVRWKTFDRAGKLLAEEREKVKTNGERIFKRRSGDYELVEFVEEN